MKPTSLPPIFLLFLMIIIQSFAFCQDCAVSADALKGTYKGDCKNGKANGQGKAVGEHTYEGHFKSGLPDGNGIYTWSNGDTYRGTFEKGLKQGQGEMTFKILGRADSIIEGYWKKDLYVGKYEYPYKVVRKTNKVTKVDIKPAIIRENQVTIWTSSTNSGAATLGGTIPVVDIANIFIRKGNYTRTYKTNTYTTKSENILYEVSYPLVIQIDLVGGQSVEVVLNEEGSYVVDITVNQ